MQIGASGAQNCLIKARAGVVVPVNEGSSMSTNATLASSDSEDTGLSWRLYEELFEAGVVYLELRGVDIEDLRTRKEGGAELVLRIPIKAAEQLGLHTAVPSAVWQRACEPDK